jgi:HPt (histidine-containing phosphotransfer) domain-containing protein
MSKLLNELEGYGVNLEVTLARFIEDEDFYVECLNAFLEEEGFKMLKKSIDKKEYIEAFNQAHTIKGVVGNLGITKLYDVICLLVESLRDKEYSNLKSQYNDCIKEYNRFVKIVKSNT